MREPRLPDRLAPALRVTVVAVVLTALGWQLWDLRTALVDAVRQVSADRIALAGAAVLAGLLPGMLGWRRLLAGLGSPLPVPDAARLYFLSSLGKYLPGGVWPIVAQSSLGRVYGLSTARVATGFVNAALLSVLAGCLVGLAAMPTLVDVHPAWWALVPVTVLGVLGLFLAVGPASRASPGRLVRRITHGSTGPLLPCRAALAAGLGWLVLAWSVTGLHVTLLADAFTPVSASTTVGGFALAGAAGMLAVVSPGGLGAREVVLCMALVPTLSVPQAVAVVAISRLLVAVGDLVAAAVSTTVPYLSSRGIPGQVASLSSSDGEPR